MTDIAATLRTIKGAIEDPQLSADVVEAVQDMREREADLQRKLDTELDAHKKTADDYAKFRNDYDGLQLKLAADQDALEKREEACVLREAEILEKRVEQANAIGRGAAMEEAFRIVFRNTAVKREAWKSFSSQCGENGMYRDVESGHGETEREVSVDEHGHEQTT